MTAAQSENAQWTAVQARDASCDGAFVYAVRTTGVYCRPSCPSRPAKRENVSFFATPLAAEAAGFRPCKRCRPDRLAHHPHLDAIRHACATLEASEQEPDLAALAHEAGLSPGHFQRVFKAEVGLSPKRYAMAVRKQRLRQELPTARTVTTAIYDAGYASHARAYADGDALGMSPGAYQKGAQGETLRYTTAHTTLGDIFVAATARGVCMVEFTTADAGLELLKARFANAAWERADAGLGNWVAQVVARIDAPDKASDRASDKAKALPLDIRGTAFQERVWQALTHIAPGDTVSYAELAERIGQPKAARAVARACATNAIAVAVPCHRVVRGTGELSGYKWGVERKRALLKREAAAKKA